MTTPLPRWSRKAAFVAALVVLGAGLFGGASAAGAPEGVEVQIHNSSQIPLDDVPLTFGQVFRRGHVPDGVTARIAGRPLPGQVDVKRRYDDGSIRFAVISPLLDELPAGGNVALVLANGKQASAPGSPIAPADLLKTGFDAVVRFEFPDGTIRSASAREFFEHSGSSVTSWHCRSISVPPRRRRSSRMPRRSWTS